MIPSEKLHVLVQMHRTREILSFLGRPVDIAIFYFLWTVFGTPWWWYGLLLLAILGSLGGGVARYRIEKAISALLGVNL